MDWTDERLSQPEALRMEANGITCVARRTSQTPEIWRWSPSWGDVHSHDAPSRDTALKLAIQMRDAFAANGWAAHAKKPVG